MRSPNKLSLVASTVAMAALLAGGATAYRPASAQGVVFPQIEQGRYLARAGDCAGCHTADESKPFAGGKAIPTPFGTIYSANITPDKETGIGNWPADAFYKAMHHGVDDEGKPLYPAMPYPWYTKMSREDVEAIRAFLMSQKPAQNDVKPPKLPWPLSIRASVGAWNLLYFHEGEYWSNPDKSAQWNRGAYLVQGAGHCGACHSPKNMLGGTQDKQALEGGEAGEHWYAPALTNDLHTGLGNWSVAEIVEYLKTGSNARSAAAGSMKEVIEKSTQHLSPGDLTAIALYLKDMPGDAPAAARRQARNAAPTQEARSQGQALYLDNCVGCHMSDGIGLPKVFPQLDGSSAIQATKPDTVIHVVVAGQQMVETKAKPTGLAMPGFAGKMTDQEIADVVSYIRNAWGNHASAVTAEQVGAVRKVAHPLGVGGGSDGTLNRPQAVRAPVLR